MRKTLDAMNHSYTRRIFSIVLGVVIAAGAAPGETAAQDADPFQWVNANRKAGTITAVAYSPKPSPGNTTFTLFAGAAEGGFYRSADQGSNWFPKALSGSNPVRDIVVSSATGFEKHVYVAVYGEGVYFSQDLGDKVGDNGAFDDGDPVFSAEPDVLSLAINNYTPVDAGDDGDVFVGTDGNGVYYSTTIKTTWTQLDGGLSGSGRLVPAIAIEQNGAGAADRVWIGTLGQGVWYIDYTAGPTAAPTGNWTSANGDLTANPTSAELSSAVVNALLVDGGRIYAGTNRGLYYSDDDGDSWTLTLDGTIESWDIPIVVKSLSFFKEDADDYWLLVGTAGSYVWRAKAVTAGVNVALPAASAAEITRPGNVGKTWLPVDGRNHDVTKDNKTIYGDIVSESVVGGFRSSTVLDFVFIDSDGVAGDDYGFAGVENGGVHGLWEGPHPSNTSGVDPSDSDNARLWDGLTLLPINPDVITSLAINLAGDMIFAGTQGSGFLRATLDNAQANIIDWFRANVGLGSDHVYALEYVNDGGDEYLFAGTWGKGVYLSENDGESWIFSGLPGRLVYDFAYDSVDDVVYAAADNGTVSRSADFGLTWQEIGVANTQIWALFLNTNGIYAGTFGAGIYKSTDDGVTWAKIEDTAGNTNINDAHIFDIVSDGTNLFAATAKGVYYAAVGADTDWEPAGANTASPRDLDTRVLGIAGNNLYAGTWGKGIWYIDRTALGGNWLQTNVQTDVPILTFLVHPDGERLFTTAEDGSFYAAAAAATVDAAPGPEVPAAYTLHQNYPNPFNPATQIEFLLAEPGQVRLAVYDVLGREVAVLVDGILSGGLHTVPFSARGLPSGTYLYRLQTRSDVLHRTMVLMK